MEKKEIKKKALLAASVAGLLAVNTFAFIPLAQAAGDKDKTEECYGINKCKGVGGCGGKDHSCAGKNDCKGKGYLEVPKGTCLKIQGGSLTPAA